MQSHKWTMGKNEAWEVVVGSVKREKIKQRERIKGMKMCNGH